MTDAKLLDRRKQAVLLYKKGEKKIEIARDSFARLPVGGVARATPFGLARLLRTIFLWYQVICWGNRPLELPGYELEVFSAVGETVAVISVRESQVEAPRRDERLCVRHTAAIGG